MTDYQLHGEPGSDFPYAMTGGGRRAGDKPTPTEVALAAFAAPSWDAAILQFQAAQRSGVTTVFKQRHGRRSTGNFWTCIGARGYLDHQAARFGVSQVTLLKAEQMTELHRVGTLIGQLYGRYQVVRGPNKPDRAFTAEEMKPVHLILAECERPIVRLHAAAAAAQMMIDDARVAFDLEPATRSFGTVAESDQDAGIMVVDREELVRLQEIERRLAEVQQHADGSDVKLIACQARIGDMEQAAATRETEHAGRTARLEAEAQSLRDRIAELEAEIASRDVQPSPPSPHPHPHPHPHPQPRKPVQPPPHRKGN